MAEHQMTAVHAIFEGQGTARVLTAGEVLFDQGSTPDAVFYVIAGELELIRTQAGHDRRVAIKTPDTLLGEAAALSDTKRSVTARAVTTTELLEMRGGPLLAALRSQAAASFEVAASLAAILQQPVSS